MKREYHSNRVCLPKVFLAGFAKCGSTFTFHQLVSHPQIVEPMCKEPRWWTSTNLVDMFNSPPATAMLLTLYLANFQTFKGPQAHRVTIDSSPNTVFSHPEGFENTCLLPSLFSVVFPKTKFIVVMRDPVDWLYSTFWHSCFSKMIPLSPKALENGRDVFHSRITQKIALLNDCFSEYSVEQCVLNQSKRFHPVSDNSIEFPDEPCGTTRIEVAIFYVHVTKWLSVMDRRSRLLFLTLEELSRNEAKVWDNVWEFLGVELVGDKYQPALEPVNVNEVDYRHDSRYEMRNDTRNVLRNFFKPFNERLADILGDRKFLW